MENTFQSLSAVTLFSLIQNNSCVSGYFFANKNYCAHFCHLQISFSLQIDRDRSQVTNLSDQIVLLGRRLLRTSTVTLVSGFIPGVELLSPFSH